MAFKLRDYQQELYDRVHDAWARVRVVMMVLATGGGKTAVFSKVMSDHNGASAAIVHRREIVVQISCSLAKLGVKHRLVGPPKMIRNARRKHLKLFKKSFVDPHALAGVASVQTLTSRGAEQNRELQNWIGQVTLMVADECHHYHNSGKWAKAVESFSRAKLLFVTACPERTDGKGLGAHADGYVEEMVEGPQVQWLIDNGYLSPFRYFAPESNLDTSGVPITPSGELNREEMRKRIVDSDLVGNIVDQYLQFSPGMQAIGFANDVATSNDVAAVFQEGGVPAVALCGADDPDKRDRELSDFETEQTKALLNVDLFDEGFDVPAAVVAMLTRKTESLNKFLQMVGRVLRPVYAAGFDLTTKEGRLAAIAAGPKPYAVIIDPVRNWERHGAPNWPRVWTLDRREKNARSDPSDTVPQKICPSCSQPYEAYYKLCPFQLTPGCATPPKPASRSAPDQVEGDLFELDVDGMAALFEKIRAADMSDEEYAQDQIARRIPPIGRRADMRRHQAAKYRRKVLKELVAWWVGLQDGRDMSEIHRRFDVRFGIDIGSAFTLNAKDTDALVERIQQRFTEDIMTCD